MVAIDAFIQHPPVKLDLAQFAVDIEARIMQIGSGGRIRVYLLPIGPGCERRSALANLSLGHACSPS
jgi:hypothetical protein